MQKFTFILGLLFVLLMQTNIAAQTTGSISGVITEAGINEPLPTVSVRILGSNLGAATDLDGRFVIRNVRPGEYTIEISFLGFKKVQVTGVRVVAGETTEINQALA